MDRLVLEARVSQQEEGFLATLEILALEVAGDSWEAAQDNLVSSFRTWLEAREEAEDLAESLARAGFSGVEDETELELQFVQ